ncbi:MAG TPA: glycosyltransferase, partial [Polyangiaceae bacterium]|nr:glycosyltransferase [Polyangiaceae bacterium]
MTSTAAYEILGGRVASRVIELDRDVLERARGRWLDFEVHVAGLRAERLTLRTTAQDDASWQAVEAELECQPGHTRLCVFLGDAVSNATLQADGEWSVDWNRAEPVAIPHRDARVPAGMSVVAWLHGAGLKELHRVELTADPEWPFAATGVDPKLGFSAPSEPGLYRVEFELEPEQGEHAPALSWDTGEGFKANQAKTFRRLHDGCFVVECAVDRTWKRWRLDLKAAPGHFRIRTLCMTPILRLPSTRSSEPPGSRISRTARLLRDLLLGAYDASDLSLDDVAAGPTRLRLTDPLNPGWYMLELRVSFEGAHAEARAYLEADPLPLPLRSGQLVKRLLHVERPATLRLLPVAAPRAFELRHFRLARVPERFARSRMERKLSSKHPRYMRQTIHESVPTPNDVHGLWAEYNRLFERSSELVTYDEWIEAVERRAYPSPTEQATVSAGWEHQPTFSIITPTYDTDPGALCECLDSVLAQTYPHWELCIADDASRAPHVKRILSDYAARDPRIRVAFREDNGHVAEASNTALSLAHGDYVTFLDHGDVLAPH